MSKMEEKREQKRQAILTAAKTTFLEDGYVLANMDKIAGAAGVTKQTVYRYFPSKPELFKAVMKKMGEQPAGTFLEELKAADDREALVNFSKKFIEFHIGEEQIALARLIIAEGAKAPELTSVFFQEGPDEVGTALVAFMRDRLKLDDPETSATILGGALHSIRTQILMGMPCPPADEIDRFAEKAARMFLPS
ncbi:TetR/AcrR family transcriptional regulator [Rhodobacteraceae bacterium RKSG542]|uniref:TetR/AcrR family transcriptional regulator n=1 Tax=Pseudovibrio flavus TaxID=2529854 RepID=UPI0012BCE381|nr:TetR/AcrR family transcriptional regulator [Pseudovibrio flavus]MTI16184.1 TetR/AcrR family transcriptional regulator [Pseudovibrio flavus]